MRPRLIIDLSGIEHNARLVSGMLRPLGIRLVGVTKACLGNELIAAAMLAGGATALADSRTENIANLRRHHPGQELQLLRPSLGVAGTGLAADICFVSSAGQAEKMLSGSTGLPLRFCLMVETGDGREGVPPGMATAEAAAITAQDGAELAGLATNAACARPGAPVAEALAILSGLAAQMDCNRVSAGGSGLLRLIVETSDPGGKAGLPAGESVLPREPFKAITEMRCGEALLLGRIPSGAANDPCLPNGRLDAFTLEATVLEAWGKGGSTKALLGLGSQDAGMAPLFPSQPGVTAVSITSDYLSVALDRELADGPPVAPGDKLTFIPSYHALLAAMTSPYVDKDFGP